MELPQELIESIIDALVGDLDLYQDPWTVDNTAEVLGALKSCALATRAFLRPCQIYIFHGVTVSDDAGLPPLVFSTLLVESPHLASYVRALYIEYDVREVEDVEPMAHILASVANLARLDLYPKSNSQQMPWEQYPGPLRASFESAFALPCLRHITLWYSHFSNALELQTLLRESTSLKTLVLRSVTFEPSEPGDTAEPPLEPSPPQVILDSLQLYFLDGVQVQELLNYFTAIDITRLRSLYVHNTPMNTLLSVNAPTIQHLKIRAYYPVAFLNGTIDAGALEGAHDLQALDLQVPYLSSLIRIARILGPFGHLARLRTISVAVSQKTHQAEWTELDDLLSVVGDLPALREVNVFSGSQFEDPDPEPLLRAWMPTLAGRDVLRVHSKHSCQWDT